MLTFLKTAAIIAAMVAIIPLSIWAATGNWRHGLHALREYLTAMAVIVVPVLLLAGLVLVTEHLF